MIQIVLIQKKVKIAFEGKGAWNPPCPLRRGRAYRTRRKATTRAQSGLQLKNRPCFLNWKTRAGTVKGLSPALSLSLLI